MFGDLLLKLASGKQLSEAEKQELRLLGNQTQNLNAFTTGLQNGLSSISVNEINANSGYVKRLTGTTTTASERSAILTATQSMPNNSNAGMYGYSDVINDGYTYEADGRINIPEDGLYSLSAVYRFSDSGSSTGTRSGYVFTDSGYSSILKIVTPVSGENTTFSISGQLRMVVGDSFRFIVFQNSGGAMDVTLRVEIRKSR